MGAKFCRAVRKDRARCGGAIVNHRDECRDASQCGVLAQGVVEDRLAAHRDGHFGHRQRLDEEAIQHNLASVVGEKEDAFGLFRRVEKFLRVASQRLVPQGGKQLRQVLGCDLGLRTAIKQIAGHGKPDDRMEWIVSGCDEFPASG